MKKIYEDILDDVDVIGPDSVSELLDDKSDYIAPETDTRFGNIISVSINGRHTVEGYLKIKRDIEYILEYTIPDASFVHMEIYGMPQTEDKSVTSADRDTFNCVRFSVGTEGLSVKRLFKMFYLIKLLKFDKAITVSRKKDNTYVSLIQVQHIETKDEMIFRMKVAAAAYLILNVDPGSVRPIDRLIRKKDESALVEELIREWNVEYIGSVNRDVDIKGLMKKQNARFPFRFAYFPTDLYGPMEETMNDFFYEQTKRDGKPVSIKRDAPYAFWRQKGGGLNYYIVSVYCGPAFCGYLNDGKFPFIVFVECMLEITDDTTWNDFRAWSSNVALMFGEKQMPDELGEQIQDTFSFYNVDLKD